MTKGYKVHSEVGIGSQSLPYGLQNEIMYNPCSNGGLGNNRIKCTKFVKDVPNVPKCVLRWRSALNHFLMGSKMKSWAIHVQMGALETIGLDVPNLMKNVPRVPNCVPRWGSTPNHFLMGSKMKSWTRWGTRK